MSNTKTVMGQASNQYVAPTDITDVFSTYLYEGTGAANTITNGIDLAGEGGMVWTKVRDWSSGYPSVHDTERGATKRLTTNTTDAESTRSGSVTAFNSDGFSVGSFGYENLVNGNVASWTFRKAPKFFDVGTISFDGSGVGSYSHNLGSVPGMVILKLTNTTGDWFVWHKDLTSQNYAMFLNATAAESNQGGWATYTDTAVSFDSSVFANDTAVVYVFAHNDGDGGFGPDGSDIIKCGNYTGNDGTQDIDLGFEPAWILVKSSSNTRDWKIIDNMRGFAASPNNKWLTPNSANSEETISTSASTIEPTATGFRLTTGDAETNASGWGYIYIAIRRGPLAPPTAATEVFAMDTLGATTPNPPSYNAGFPVDLGIMKSKTSGTDFWRVGARLTGEKRLRTDSADAEATDTQHKFDYQDGWYDAGSYVDSQYQSWMWKRAPGYFDVVAYTGNSTAGRTVSHNLGVAPEMMWVKQRSSGNEWFVYVGSLGNTNKLELDNTSASGSAAVGGNQLWNSTTPTSSVFSVSDNARVNESGQTYIAYLFASLPGISKVGSYSGNNSSQTIDCGFTTGARLVLIKASSRSGSWSVWDSARGITAGDDPRLELNSTSAEQSQSNIDVEPHSSGFIIDSTSGEFNEAGETYIFYAIA